MKKLVVYIVLLIGVVGFAQKLPKVSAKADTTKIKIGEQINFEIIVDDANKGVVFPEIELDSFRKIEVVESLPIDTLKNRFIKKYKLTSFDSGQHVLPPQKVLIWSQEYLTDSLKIDVNTVAVDTLKQPLYEIKAIQKEPKTFEDYKEYVWWGLGLLLAIILIGLLIRYILRNRATEDSESYIPAYDLALKRLSELDEKQLWQQNKIKQYYIELTDIVRTYIERELKVPALESTTDELLTYLEDFNTSSTSLNIPKEAVDKLNKLLKEADLVKFAKFKPLANEIELRRKDTDGILTEIHKNIPKDIEVDKPKCIITQSTNINDAIALYKWGYIVISFTFRKKVIAVSALGNMLHSNKQSFFWKIFNAAGNFFIKIPFIGGTLLVIWAAIVVPFLLLVAIVEFFITGSFLNRGVVYLGNNGTVKTKNVTNASTQAEVEATFIKRKAILKFLQIMAILLPMLYVAFVVYIFMND